MRVIPGCPRGSGPEPMNTGPSTVFTLNCCALCVRRLDAKASTKENEMERNVQLRRELLAEVEAVAPTLAEHAADSEGLARLNPTSIEALRNTRLLRFICPKERGGDEADPLTHLEIIEALAKIARPRGLSEFWQARA